MVDANYLLGASMRIGALMPRYSLDALRAISMVKALGVSSLPFVPHDLAEAVQHAAVSILTSSLSGLKLSI